MRIGQLSVLVAVGFRYFGGTFFLLFRNLDGTQFLLFFNVSQGFVLGFRFGFFSQIDDIIGFIADIADVDVHQVKTEFLQFGVDVLAAVLKECITITVQLFDGHVGNDQMHLSVNNVFNQFLLCFDIQSQ